MSHPLEKDPGSVLDYVIDWSQWLPEGDVIGSSSFTVPAELTITDESFDDISATVWLSGGVLGKTYKITNQIVTSPGGRQDERSFKLKIVDK